MPVPETPIPTPAFVFIQLCTLPAGVPVNIVLIFCPPHTLTSVILFTTGVGFTVIVNTVAVPTHELAVGITLIVATCVVITFGALKEGILPVPFAAKPMAVLLFVHANTVLTGTAMNGFTFTGCPPHTAILLCVLVIIGVGLIVTVNVIIED